MLNILPLSPFNFFLCHTEKFFCFGQQQIPLPKPVCSDFLPRSHFFQRIRVNSGAAVCCLNTSYPEKFMFIDLCIDTLSTADPQDQNFPSNCVSIVISSERHLALKHSVILHTCGKPYQSDTEPMSNRKANTVTQTRHRYSRIHSIISVTALQSQNRGNIPLFTQVFSMRGDRFQFAFRSTSAQTRPLSAQTAEALMNWLKRHCL